MDNKGDQMFKALSSETRRKMLRILAKKEMHISGLAREIGVSTPVVAKHVKILEEKGLIERKKFGKTHVLKVNIEKLYEALIIFSDSYEIEVPRGSNILDALKKVSGVRVEKVGDKEFLTSIDGEEGYYIYEVNEEFPEVSMGDYEVKDDIKVELKKLVPLKRKEVFIKVIK